MEPRSETANDREVFLRTFPSREGSPPLVPERWSEENHCYIVKGVKAAIPISGPIPFNVTNNEACTSGRRRSRKNEIIQREEEFFFKLFKFPRAEEHYLLEIHEIKTGGIDRYQVFFIEKNGKWKIVVHELVPGDHIVVRVPKDPTIPIFHKTYDIPMEERLREWSKEKRQRGSKKHVKVYYHRKKAFYSFNEVITFIIYSCNGKDLKSANKTTQEVHAFEATEAMLTISSSNVTMTSFKH